MTMTNPQVTQTGTTEVTTQVTTQVTPFGTTGVTPIAHRLHPLL